MLRITLGGLLLCLAGCASGDHEQASLTAPNEEAVSKPSPVLACLHRLLDTPVAADASILQSPHDDVEIVAIATPEDLANDGRRHTLHIDRESQLAWISIDGGIADNLHNTTGPWPLTDPHVENLIVLLQESATK